MEASSDSNHIVFLSKFILSAHICIQTAYNFWKTYSYQVFQNWT